MVPLKTITLKSNDGKLFHFKSDLLKYSKLVSQFNFEEENQIIDLDLESSCLKFIQ